VVSRKRETPKPKRRKLIQDSALARNRIGKNDVKGGKPIGRDEKERFAEVKDFADFAAAEFLYSRKIERSDG
jgi:hypothetical protein